MMLHLISDDTIHQPEPIDFPKNPPTGNDASGGKAGKLPKHLEELLKTIEQDCTTQTLSFLEKSNIQQNGE